MRGCGRPSFRSGDVFLDVRGLAPVDAGFAVVRVLGSGLGVVKVGVVEGLRGSLGLLLDAEVFAVVPLTAGAAAAGNTESA